MNYCPLIFFLKHVSVGFYISCYKITLYFNGHYCRKIQHLAVREQPSPSKSHANAYNWWNLGSLGNTITSFPSLIVREGALGEMWDEFQVPDYHISLQATVKKQEEMIRKQLDRCTVGPFSLSHFTAPSYTHPLPFCPGPGLRLGPIIGHNPIVLQEQLNGWDFSKPLNPSIMDVVVTQGPLSDGW